MRDKDKLLSILAILLHLTILVKADHMCNLQYRVAVVKDLTYMKLGLNFRHEFIINPEDGECQFNFDWTPSSNEMLYMPTNSTKNKMGKSINYTTEIYKWY